MERPCLGKGGTIQKARDWNLETQEEVGWRHSQAVSASWSPCCDLLCSVTPVGTPAIEHSLLDMARIQGRRFMPMCRDSPTDQTSKLLVVWLRRELG